MRIDTTNIKRLIRNASLATIAVVGLSAVMPSAAEATVRVRVRAPRARVVVAPRVVVRVAPVKTTVVVRPAKPVQGKYVWVSGHYMKKPGCRRVWIKGHWKRIG
ncbi:hypothetical protein H8E07_20195 [bacterium]|nr:hypothetical protein [bacterium]